ncbi:MAG: stage II sporulation protein M [Nanoarchaeota archaeon]|nr:stage II sporulation protein M [Nanoarchaeota archaeon]MBU1270518.1 stage II sporulation protein M [Nanoarchaeota archaeon]MBU1605139.1 stage II sporulation protein M [Nanoarchaeota archaeon]MBU2442696.1 stage II sporulation protein M [Nanoarchaeota archaeon]
MVLESLTDPFKSENHPARLILFGFVFSSVAIFLSLWIFRLQSSLIMVFLTVMASIPLLYGIIKLEEEKDLQDLSEKMLLKEHSKALMAFMSLFIGVTLSCTLWYVVLPADTVSVLFETQTSTIQSINSNVTGQAINSLKAFSSIFFNNMKVLILCVLFSFIYGMGAIFILTWNASVIGTAMGNFIRSNLAYYSNLVGFEKVTQYFQIISIGLLKYIIHGLPEILAYFVAGLAGGIISVAVIRHDFGTRKFEHILLDSADLLLLSIFILFLAGLLEVYVTPAIF